MKNLRTFKLFGERWSIGGLGKNNHSVIYGPNRKEYHIYGKDSLNLRIGCSEYERADIEKTKLYILTNILDSKENWNFNTKIIPENKRLKVIYEGITIKWIDFPGNWDDCKLKCSVKFPARFNSEWYKNHKLPQFIYETRDIYKKVIAWKYENN